MGGTSIGHFICNPVLGYHTSGDGTALLLRRVPYVMPVCFVYRKFIILYVAEFCGGVGVIHRLKTEDRRLKSN